MIDGDVAPGFEPVADVFRENFARRGELGAAFAVYRGQERLVDLWGGIANKKTGAPWKRDTAVLVFSTTKGMAAMAMALAQSRGLFDYEAPVARYWPEFAQAGKGEVTVRQLLGHQAGLAIMDAKMTRDMLLDPARLDPVLARQVPNWKPGERQGYHPTTLGFYESALLRRCDPKQRGVGGYFADEIAKPLGLDFWMSLPRDVAEERLARMSFSVIPSWPNVPPGLALASVNPWSFWVRALMNPPIDSPDSFGSAEFLRIEHPSTMGVGEVRAIAKAYAEFASGSPVLGVSKATLDALAAPAQLPSGGGFDRTLRTQTRFSLGFLKNWPGFSFGSSDTAYGSPGMGGSFAFADPDRGIGIAYAPNRMGIHLNDDPREKALRDAVYKCLK